MQITRFYQDDSGQAWAQYTPSEGRESWTWEGREMESESIAHSLIPRAAAPGYGGRKQEGESPMVTTVAPAEQRIVLQNISWQTFKAMLSEMGSERGTRLAYCEGTVEIMSPLMPHENSNRLIEGFVVALCEELGLEIKRAGSLTLTRDDLERGGEPDSSYYIQNESLVRDKEDIDLESDPPPDLVLEVEYSRSKINKLELYASMGIPEFWRYNGRVLRIYSLEEEQYVECSTSPTFTPVRVNEIPRFITQSRKIGEIASTRAFRAWVRQQIQPQQ